MTGRSIRIYLVDGDASCLLTAEVKNWFGRFLVAPHSMFKMIVQSCPSAKIFMNGSMIVWKAICGKHGLCSGEQRH